MVKWLTCCLVADVWVLSRELPILSLYLIFKLALLGRDDSISSRPLKYLKICYNSLTFTYLKPDKILLKNLLRKNKEFIKKLLGSSRCGVFGMNSFGSASAEIQEPNLGFWEDVNIKCHDAKDESDNIVGRPICVLAPMADVTDCAFRYVIAKYGKPDVLWTEFVAADGLIRATPEGKKKLLADLKFSKELEKPIVAQLFGSNPKYMEEACEFVAGLGYDGIDLNMGCPDKSIEKQGAGASMMKNPKLAKEIIFSAMRGVENFAKKESEKTGSIIKPIPVTVKTRVGYNKDELDSWLKNILETSPAVVTIHARTRKEMSKVPANWDYVKRAVLIRDKVQENLINEGKQKTLIFGNGDDR